jgi:hypothetical protein
LASLVVGASAANPRIDFLLIEFPKPADFMARHLPFADPIIDRIPLDAEMASNLIHGEPSVFHHFTPLTFGLIGSRQRPLSFVWLMNRCPVFQPKVCVRSEKQGKTLLHYPAGDPLSNVISGYSGDLTNSNQVKASLPASGYCKERNPALNRFAPS